MADQEGARKNGEFLVVCTTPDVCKTPVGNSVVPVPYQITSSLSDSMSTSPNVRFRGNPVFLLGKSAVSKVTGDEAGTAGGVASGTNRAMVNPIEGSSTVRVNGHQVVRHGDVCEMNNGNTRGKVIYQGESAGGGNASTPPMESETPEEAQNGLWSKLSDGVHTGLDLLGFVPLLGAVPDLANAAIYGMEGNASMAALSAVAAVPGYGDAVKGGAMVIKGGKAIARQISKQAAKELTEKAAKKTEKEIAEGLIKEKLEKEAAQQAAMGQSKKGLKVAGKQKAQVNSNKAQGDKFANEELERFRKSTTETEKEITIKTKDGTKTRVDGIARDKVSGDIRIQEYKSSETAPLTKNQKVAFPQIEDSGGVVVGKGKGVFSGGTSVPPTKIEIIRPK